MKAKIDKSGLWIYRKTEWVLQVCPITKNYCGQTCPHFKIGTSEIKYLYLCGGTSHQLQELIDER